jgi:two-component sensor histidine kinase
MVTLRSPNSSAPRLRISATVWLVLLSVATLLPLIGFTAFSVSQISDTLLSIDQRRVRERAEALSASADREIRGMLGTAEALSTSSYLVEGKLAEFYGYAKNVVGGRQANVIVLDRSLQQLVNTRVEFGVPLPKTSAVETSRRAIETRQTNISDLFLGQVAQRFVFNVTVPVVVGDQVRYLLILTAEPDRVQSLLEEQRLRDGWHGAVFDSKWQVVATDFGEPGKLGATRLEFERSSEMASGTGNIAVAGEPSLASSFQSPLTGWTSLVWVPKRVHYAPIGEMWRTLVGASVFAIALSSLLAYLFSLPLAKLIRQAVAVIQKVGSGERLPSISTFFSESDEIAKRLAEANEQLVLRQRELVESARRVEQSERRLRLALPVAKMAIIDRDLMEDTVVRIENGVEVLGLARAEFTPGEWAREFLAIVHPGDRTRVEEARKRSETVPGLFAYDFRVVKPGGGIAWVETKGESVGNAGFLPARVVKTVTDITARKHSEQSVKLISRELAHRAKNLMTVVLGIATQTARTTISQDEFLRSFSRRIEGLGRSHDLLIQSNWNGAPLAELVSTQLAAFGGADGNRIRTNGPDIVLKNDVLQSLGLAFHELGTNAVKYGALSRPSGSIDIAWRIEEVDGKQMLRLTWSESGGPPVKESKRKGFGNVITVRSLARVVSGEANIEFRRTGIVWTVDAPLEAVKLDPDAVNSGEMPGTAMPPGS